jgi:uncharacterized protein with FMN-binding domain
MKKIAVIGGVLLIFTVGAMLLMFQKLDRDAQVILEEEVNELNLEGLMDGVYEGEYMEALATNAKVEVTMEDGQIVDIVLLKHSNGRGEDAEGIIEDILESQSILVDDVSGATYSSRVIKLAVIDALEGDLHE